MTNLELNPEQICLSELEKSFQREKQLHIVENVSPLITIDAFAFFKKDANNLVVLLPSAQPGGRSPINPVFHRWSWYKNLPNTSVISLSDPTLHLADINASWFLHKEIDFIEEIAGFVKKLAKCSSIEEPNITFYGSSMGGFASLMLASFFDRASAIVEVPQLNFMNYPFESAKKLVEDCLLEDISLKQLFSRFPERLSVVERFAKNKRIPNIKVLSNTSDEGFNELLELVNSIEKLRDRVSSYGDFQIQIMAETIGHKPLQTAQVIPIIQQYIAENKMFNTKLIHNPSQEIDGDYKATLDNALAFASKVKYIRTDEDSKNYEKSLSELYRAAAINQKADWPFLKICSMLKLWNNSFNAELFDAAKKALERKETLEGFIYFCRGAVSANLNPHTNKNEALS